MTNQFFSTRMNQRFTQLAMLIAAFAFTACGSDDAGNGPVASCSLNTATFLYEELIEEDGNNIDVFERSTLTVTRNTEGQITQIIEVFDRNECEVDDAGNKSNCFPGSFTKQTDFEYNGNEISVITFNEEQNLLATIVYENGQISTYTSFDLNDDGDTTDVNQDQFIYENDQLIRVDIYDGDDPNSLELVRTNSFRYEGGNIVEATLSEANGGGTLEVNTYTFDNNTNPVSGEIVFYILSTTFDDLYDIPVLFSENNITSIQFDEKVGNMDQSTTTITYSYDGNGLPTDATYTKDNSSYFDLTLTYNCQ